MKQYINIRIETEQTPGGYFVITDVDFLESRPGLDCTEVLKQALQFKTAPPHTQINLRRYNYRDTRLAALLSADIGLN